MWHRARPALPGLHQGFPAIADACSHTAQRTGCEQQRFLKHGIGDKRCRIPLGSAYAAAPTAGKEGDTFPSQQVRVIVQECLHRGGNMAVPNGIADKHDVIRIETFHRCGDGGIVALGDGIQFRLRTVEHRIVVILVWSFRLYNYHIAIQCGLDSLRHTLGIACTGAIEDEVSAVTSFHISAFFVVSFITFFPVIFSGSGLFLSVRRRIVFATCRSQHKRSQQHQWD